MGRTGWLMQGARDDRGMRKAGHGWSRVQCQASTQKGIVMHIVESSLVWNVMLLLKRIK